MINLVLRDFFQIWVSAFLTEDFEYTFHFVLLGETGATTFQIVKSAYIAGYLSTRKTLKDIKQAVDVFRTIYL